MTTLLNRHCLIDGHRIAYGVHGEGPPAVLIHGTPAHSFIWRRIVPQLVSAERRVHVFDLLGYGASERPLAADTSVAGQEAILSKLLDAWDLQCPDVVGHDIGGAIALRLAIHAPGRLRSLTLIDPVSYDSWPSPTWRTIIETYPEGGASIPTDEFRTLISRQLRMAVHDEGRMSGAVLAEYLRPVSGDLEQTSFFRHQVGHYDSRYTQEIVPALIGLKTPVHLIWGSEDRWQPVSWGYRLAGDLGAELTMIPEAGHFVMEDAPETVGAAILESIRIHEGAHS